MKALINFILGWADLITAVFKEHTLAAAVLTAVAVFVFLEIDKENQFRYKIKVIQHASIVLLGWAIFVPIAGWIMGLVGDLLDLIVFIYKKFEQQPIVVIILAVLCALAPYVWLKVLKHRAPPLLVRVTVSVLAFIVLTALVVPIFNLFSDSGLDKPRQEQTEPNNAMQRTHFPLRFAVLQMRF